MDPITKAEELCAFDIALYPTGDSSSFHTKNDPAAPFQRDNIVERTDKVDVRCEHKDVVHGYYSDDVEDPCTLIVLEFQLNPNAIARRIKQANIVIQFAAMKKGGHDPVVEAMHPKGIIPVHPTTQRETLVQGGGVNLGGGAGGAQLSGELKAEKTINRDTTNATMVRGSIDLRGRTWGGKNSVSWTLWENASTKTGVVSSLQAAVLLKRRDMEHFKATITLKVETDIRTRIGCIFKSVPEDDDIWYDPKTEPPSTDRLYKYDLDNLGLLDLESISYITFIGVKAETH